jgi:hypothetical protein
MPPRQIAAEPNPTGFGPLSLSELRVIRRWIDDGAPSCGAVPSDGGVDAPSDSGGDASSDAVTDSITDAPAG